MSKRARDSVKSHSKASSKKKGKVSAQAQSLKKSKLTAARMVANAVSMGFLGIEKKFLDCTKPDTAIANTAGLASAEFDPAGVGCTGCLSAPAQGDTEQSRDGKRIVIDSLILKGYVMGDPSNNAALGESSKVFVAVVLDTQTNVTQLNSEDVFKNTLNTAAGCVCPLKNLLFGKRFRILKSQVYDLTPYGLGTGGAAATASYSAVRKDFDWYIPFKTPLAVNLNAGTDANVANVIDNSIHVIAFHTGAGNASIGYNSRIRFQG